MSSMVKKKDNHDTRFVQFPNEQAQWSAVKELLGRAREEKEPHSLCKLLDLIYQLSVRKPRRESVFPGLQIFLVEELTLSERETFFNKTFPHIVDRALEIEEHKPTNGILFSQQQIGKFCVIYSVLIKTQLH